VVLADVAQPVVEVELFVLPAGVDAEVGGSPLLLLVWLAQLVSGVRRRVHHPVLQRGTIG
jgi:hypothetical protein